jgi:hypothetical protein
MSDSTYDNETAQRLADFIDSMTADLPNSEHRNDFNAMLESAIRVVRERREAREASELAMKRVKFKAERGVLGPAEYRAKYGLSEKEFMIAVDRGWITGVNSPLSYNTYSSGRYADFFVDKPIPDDKRAMLPELLNMTAWQAADYLGIEKKEFDKLRKKHNIQYVDTFVGNSGYLGYLYRETDIIQMAKAAGLKIPERPAPTDVPALRSEEAPADAKGMFEIADRLAITAPLRIWNAIHPSRQRHIFNGCIKKEVKLANHGYDRIRWAEDGGYLVKVRETKHYDFYAITDAGRELVRDVLTIYLYPFDDNLLEEAIRLYGDVEFARIGEMEWTVVFPTFNNIRYQPITDLKGLRPLSDAARFAFDVRLWRSYRTIEDAVNIIHLGSSDLTITPAQLSMIEHGECLPTREQYYVICGAMGINHQLYPVLK